MITVSSREQVFAALFSHMQANTSLSALVKTFTRRLKHWADVPTEDQPALYMEHTGESASVTRGLPTAIVLEVNFWLYVKTSGDPTGPILNPLLDAVESALAPANNGEHVQTLNGLVHHCWIEGQTQIFEGDLGDEAVAIIPVKILVT